MFDYAYCNLLLKSNIAVPELQQSSDDTWGLSFQLESGPLEFGASPWLHHWWSPAGERLVSYCQQDSHHLLQFPNLAGFRIAEDASIIYSYPFTDVPVETIRHLLLDQVLPRCLAHQGKIMLHASAVRHEQGLLLFIGNTGAGKSTLAGNFHLAGDPAVSDDCVWILEDMNRIVAVPTYGGLRLWKDSLKALFTEDHETASMAHYSAKRRVQFHQRGGSQNGAGLPVLAVMVLSLEGQKPISEIVLEELPHRESFIALLKQTFQLDVTDMERMTSHMQALGRIVPRIKAYRLSMPRDYALLSTVRQRILDAIL